MKTEVYDMKKIGLFFMGMTVMFGAACIYQVARRKKSLWYFNLEIPEEAKKKNEVEVQE